MTETSFIGDISIKAGIYLILHSVSSSVYVGQSVNIRTRLGQHYEMLTTGTHHNKPLQSLWSNHPPESFSTSEYLACPQNLSPLERQRWLVKAERQAIQDLKTGKNVLNEAEPEIVETPDALFEYKRKKEAKDKAKTTTVSGERREIKHQLAELNQRLAPLRVARGSCLHEIAKREMVLRKSKSLLSFLFGRPTSESIPEQEVRLAALKARLSESEAAITPDQIECDKLAEKYRSLYYGFPKVQEQLVKRFSRGLFPVYFGRKKPTITEEDKEF